MENEWTVLHMDCGEALSARRHRDGSVTLEISMGTDTTARSTAEITLYPDDLESVIDELERLGSDDPGRTWEVWADLPADMTLADYMDLAGETADLLDRLMEWPSMPDRVIYGGIPDADRPIIDRMLECRGIRHTWREER